MIEFIGKRTKPDCDGVSRRTALTVGALSLGGATMTDLLRAQASAASPRKDAAVILVWLGGGPSHIDMYDLKPDAPAEFRGEFKPIETNVSGMRVSEHLPQHARIADKFSVVRSVTHSNAGHAMAAQWMNTGRMPTLEIQENVFPSMGSINAKLRGANAEGVPAFVNLPHEAPFNKAAYLGASYNPFHPGSDPNSPYFEVRNLKRSWRVSAERLDDRRALLREVDGIRRDLDDQGVAVGLDSFYREAMEMIVNPRAVAAFDLNREHPRTRDAYGRNTWGQSALMARRLVEAGVGFVTVDMGGWDTHGQNFQALRENLLPKYDRAVAALVGDVYERGLGDRVVVLTMGEFGRTPRVNPGSGRDHWPGAMSVLFAGGGLKVGSMIGRTDARAEYPTERPVTPGDVLATVYHTVGIDRNHTFHDNARRPMPVLSEGSPIPELTG
ncbi:MAG: DUF1501 domain-containing protein [Planctomycetia bacterium]